MQSGVNHRFEIACTMASSGSNSSFYNWQLVDQLFQPSVTKIVAKSPKESSLTGNVQLPGDSPLAGRIELPKESMYVPYSRRCGSGQLSSIREPPPAVNTPTKSFLQISFVSDRLVVFAITKYTLYEAESSNADESHFYSNHSVTW